MENINYNAIQEEIELNKDALNNYELDPFKLMSNLSIKYIKPVDKLWSKRMTEDPFTDLLIAMFEINGIDLD